MLLRTLHSTRSATLAILAVSLLLGIARAQTETVLHSFTGNSDGLFPLGGVVFDAQGNLYGTTYEGGDYYSACNPGRCGTVFKVTPSGTETVLYGFAGGGDGAFPSGGLVLDKSGNLYGTTWEGGAYNVGTVFRVTPSGTETVLYSFTGEPDAPLPSAGLVLDKKGNLYGTTTKGGAYNGGTVFRVTLSGEESVLHSFGAGTDGAFPSGGLVRDKTDNLYGATGRGGANDLGIVFKVVPSGEETVLYSFAGQPDGAHPDAGLVFDKKGNLYGTTIEGGTYKGGAVFKVTPWGKERVLYSFGAAVSDGTHPQAGLVFDTKGNLYGTTVNGGTSNLGTAFKVSPSGAERVLHSFGAYPDGVFPEAELVFDAKGTLYGTSEQGGANGGGTVFKLVP